VLPYRLAAIDLDDTLLGPDKRIGAANAAAVARLRERGVRVVLASGRRHENMRQFYRQLDLDTGVIVSCNGALVRDEHNGQVLHERRVPADLAAEVIEEGDRLGVTMNYYHAEGHLYVRELNRWTALYQGRTGSELEPIGDLVQLSGDRPLKIIWVADGALVEELFPAMRARFDGRLYTTVTDPEYLEFMAVGVNKAAGLAAAAEHFGVVPEEVVAFGDGNNDVEMLRWAGLGVAMSHGRASAKEAADRVAPPGDPESDLARAVDALLAEYP
jgi:Cof subfamily protein (haloacid dehalogenase superfamily)